MIEFAFGFATGAVTGWQIVELGRLWLDKRDPEDEDTHLQ